MKGFDFDRLRIPGIRVMAVKEIIVDLPFADVLFALDRPWMVRRADWIRENCKAEVFLAPTGLERDHGLVPRIANATYLKLARFEGFSDDPETIQSGGNSGNGSVNLAYLKRAGRNGKPVVLFGFDYIEKDGHHHYSAERYHWYPLGRNARYWKNWGDNFNACMRQITAAGMTILNASTISTVECFPKITHEQALDCLHRLRSA
jgi:hypothetical protein